MLPLLVTMRARGVTMLVDGQGGLEKEVFGSEEMKKLQSQGDVDCSQGLEFP